MLPTLMTVTFLISASLTQHLSHPQTALPLVDQPNARSLHNRPIPVSGGIAILAALALSLLCACFFYMPVQPLLWLCLSGLLIAVISLLDDWRQVAVVYRLFIHFLAALLLLWQGQLWLTALTLPGLMWIAPQELLMFISLLFVVWMVNLYNFMDGMDGFAGGMTLFGFGTLAIFGALGGQFIFMLVNLLIISAVAGFLVFNFPPARIFMGDVGASTLGFLAAALSLWGQQLAIVPLWIALLLFSPFIVDATVTLLRRLFQGEKIWLAHKTHYYQRLVQLGWGHRRTVLWEYGLMVACSVSALLAPQLPLWGQWGLLMLWALIYGLLIYFVTWLEERYHKVHAN